MDPPKSPECLSGSIRQRDADLIADQISDQISDRRTPGAN
jgi:hypothetical protein